MVLSDDHLQHGRLCTINTKHYDWAVSSILVWAIKLMMDWWMMMIFHLASHIMWIRLCRLIIYTFICPNGTWRKMLNVWFTISVYHSEYDMEVSLKYISFSWIYLVEMNTIVAYTKRIWRGTQPMWVLIIIMLISGNKRGRNKGAEHKRPQATSRATEQ